MTKTFIDDFLYVVNSVWGREEDYKLFEKRYIENPYGRSLLTVVYKEGKPVATDAMWRNDILDVQAYQTIDTCTVESCRGKGLFRSITQKELDILGDVLVYGFPNLHSKPGYIKFGWKVLHNRRMRIMLSGDGFEETCPCVIDESYAQWYLSSMRNRIFSYRWRRRHYLVLPTSRRRLVLAIGGCNEKTASLFEPVKGYPLIIYSPQPYVEDEHKQGSVVVMNHRGEHIPLWKCDAL